MVTAFSIEAGCFIHAGVRLKNGRETENHWVQLCHYWSYWNFLTFLKWLFKGDWKNMECVFIHPLKQCKHRYVHFNFLVFAGRPQESLKRPYEQQNKKCSSWLHTEVVCGSHTFFLALRCRTYLGKAYKISRVEDDADSFHFATNTHTHKKSKHFCHFSPFSVFIFATWYPEPYSVFFYLLFNYL